MNRVYSEQALKEFEEKKISFTYRLEFEQKLKELSEEIQEIIIANFWTKEKILCESVCPEPQNKLDTTTTKKGSLTTYTTKNHDTHVQKKWWRLV